jgi:sec-independent protein translocase protein TatA
MTDYTFAAGNFGSPMQLLIIAVIVLILFGGSRLRNIGGDLGNAIKGFKKAMSDGDKTKEPEKEQDKISAADTQKIIEGTLDKSATEKDKAPLDKDSSK